MNVNDIQIPYDKHHKVSSLVSHQNTRNSVKYEVKSRCQITKYEVLIEQYLCSILDMHMSVLDSFSNGENLQLKVTHF